MTPILIYMMQLLLLAAKRLNTESCIRTTYYTTMIGYTIFGRFGAILFLLFGLFAVAKNEEGQLNRVKQEDDLRKQV